MILPTADDTMRWGHALAAELTTGTVVALVGGLGAGKTHAVKGIVAGLGSSAEVNSPTFTLVHEYSDGRIPAFHFDFYRLEDPREVLQIGWDDYLDANGLVLVEWADKFPDLIPIHARWFQWRPLPEGGRCVEEVKRETLLMKA